MTNFRNWTPVVLIALLFFISQIFSAGKEPNALLSIELIGSLILLHTLWFQTYKGRLSKTIWFCIISGILIPIIYLIPIPLDLWLKLPYRSHYEPILKWVTEQTGTLPWISLSLIPQKTFHALIAITPLLSVFLATAGLKSKQIKVLVYLFLLATGIQAIWAMLQASNGSPSFYRTDDVVGAIVGGLRNRDSLSTLMYLAIPTSIGLLFYSLTSSSIDSDEDYDDSRSLNWLINLLLALLTTFLVTASVLSASRGGIFLSFVAVLLSLFIFFRSITLFKSAGIIFTIFSISFVIISSVGIIPVINRFIALDPLEDGRGIIFETTIQGIKSFFPFGSGPSTFQDIYRNFQAIDDINFTNHAHNDYLELLLETGLIGGIWGILSLLVFLSGWWFLRTLRWTDIKYIKIGAGLSTTLFLVHGLVDFNFHTPANALAWVFLAAIFLKKESSNKKAQ